MILSPNFSPMGEFTKITGNRWFVSYAEGDDTNSGAERTPFKTLVKAWTVIQPGDYVFLRGGTHYLSQNTYLTGKNGAPGARINIWNYPGELPVITRAATFTTPNGIEFSGNYFHWRGIEIANFMQTITYPVGTTTGFRQSFGSYNIFENMNCHHSGLGMGIYGDSGDCNGNLILNCDFHHNYDPYTPDTGTNGPYGNADGLNVGHCAYGTTNHVIGCRFWYNSDDGVDFWGADGLIIAKNNWAFYNGLKPDLDPAFIDGGLYANGNGFKLGQTNTDQSANVLRKLSGNIAYRNKWDGISLNGARLLVELTNNTCYNNGEILYNGGSGGQRYGTGINLMHYYPDGSQINIAQVVKNNLCYGNHYSTEVALWSAAIHDHNSWDSGLNVTDNDFVSLDYTQLFAPRNSDGSLPILTFLKLKPTSSLVNAGTPIADVLFNGSAPDIGAIEL